MWTEQLSYIELSPTSKGYLLYTYQYIYRKKYLEISIYLQVKTGCRWNAWLPMNTNWNINTTDLLPIGLNFWRHPKYISPPWLKTRRSSRIIIGALQSTSKVLWLYHLYQDILFMVFYWGILINDTIHSLISIYIITTPWQNMSKSVA